MSSEWEKADPLSAWTFSVANAMITIGERKPLQYNDLMLLPVADKVGLLTDKLQNTYDTSSSFLGVPRLLVALLKCHWWPFLLVNIYCLIEGAVRIASPVVLYLLLEALQNSESDKEPYTWAAVLCALNLAQSIIHHILFFITMRMGNNWKTSSMGLIYRRLFRLRSSMMTSVVGTGRLVNMVSNDVGRFEEAAVFLSFAYISFFEMVAILVILIVYLNVASAFAGVGMTVVLIPVQMYMANQFAAQRRKTAAMTDQRVRFISEVIDGISTVKSYGWETPFFRLIESFRNKEIEHIDDSNRLRSVNLALYFFTPTVAAFAIFAVFWATNGTLNLPLVFSVMALLQQLRVTVGRQWTQSIMLGSEAVSSSCRVEDFLRMTEREKPSTLLESQEGLNQLFEKVPQNDNTGVQCTAAGNEMEIDTSNAVLVEIANATFTYDESSSQEISEGGAVEPPSLPSALKNISFTLSAGELMMVVGPVGAGKSSFLAAVLGEINGVERGMKARVKRGVRFAYCAQSPWIIAGTVKSNITVAVPRHRGDGIAGGDDDVNTTDERGPVRDEFKAPVLVDEKLYRLALQSCRVIDDLKQWPAQDHTEIGERGISISGGQKARIALARAIMADADVYVLDDILSAVDAHVGRALFFDCIMRSIRGRGKGVILASHQLQYLKYADKVLVLDKDGTQRFCGSFMELQSRRGEFDYIDIPAADGFASQESASDLAKFSDTESTPEEAKDCVRGDSSSSANQPCEPVSEKVKNIASERRKTESIGAQQEDRREGELEHGQILTYLISGGTIFGVFVLSVAFLSQGIQMIADYWLRWWASDTFWSQTDDRYVWILALLTLACILFGFYRVHFWFKFATSAAKSLHEKALWAVLHSPIYFFVANPTGRILNRFSRDQYLVDESLPMVMFDFLQCVLFCLAAIILVCVSVPWLILLMPPLLSMFVIARQKYIKSSREIKRIDATLRSPVYSDFSATLTGLATLRAYRIEDIATRSFETQIDRNTRAWFSFLMVSRWLGFRLDIQSALVLAAVAFVAVALRSSVDVGLIGFTLTYALSLSGLLQWCCRQSAEVEALLTSVERVSAYAELPPEDGYWMTLQKYKNNEERNNINNIHKRTSRQDDSQTEVGRRTGSAVSIKNLTVSYRHDAEPVLRGITVDIPAGKKVGICGRTGSGKSSTLLALLRLNLITEGDILVDGESLLHMDLERARHLVCTIPQEPHLFSGTVRFNLDPFSEYSDIEIWSALADAHFRDFIASHELGLGLDLPVEESGKNFSVGQRQLMSLARAILRRSPVVLMDEVTASIDYQTDRLIQQTIRESSALREATIITVAHRLRTIADSDLIVVVDAGRIVETGRPWRLLQGIGMEEDGMEGRSLSQGSSLFRALAVDSNEFDEIARLAAAGAAAGSDKTGISQSTMELP